MSSFLDGKIDMTVRRFLILFGVFSILASFAGAALNVAIKEAVERNRAVRENCAEYFLNPSNGLIEFRRKPLPSPTPTPTEPPTPAPTETPSPSITPDPSLNWNPTKL